MKGDFYYLPEVGFRGVLFIIYVLVIAAYIMKETALLWKSIAMHRRQLWKNAATEASGLAQKNGLLPGSDSQLRNSIATSDMPKPAFNLPRNAIILGTFLSWYVGIVHFNSDIAFTAINVMSHGIPYMALVWMWGNKRYAFEPSARKHIFRLRYVALFVGLLLALAYIEEGFWNVWVWHEKDHAPFFTLFHMILTEIEAGSPWLTVIVPFLSVPQITHYVIDGFIWKMRNDTYGWARVVGAVLPAPKP